MILWLRLTLVLGLLVAGLGSYWAVYRYGDAAGYTRASAQATVAALRSSEEARAKEAKFQKEKSDALQAAGERIIELEADNQSAAAASSRLRHLLAAAKSRTSTAAESAVRQYAATATTVLEECEREYKEMGRRAQGHANDVRTLIDGWPKN